MNTYLISHSTDKGTQVAQAQINARTEHKAVKKFADRYPQRAITAIGIKGVGG